MIVAERQYLLAANYPVLWQLKLPYVLGCSLAATVGAVALSYAITAGAQSHDAPDIHRPYQYLALLSFMATIVWLSFATKHFRVAVQGYRSRSPATSLVLLSMLLIWLPVVTFGFSAAVQLKRVASASTSSSGYLKMHRAVSILGFGTHFEKFSESDDDPLASQDNFNRKYVQTISTDALEAFRLFSAKPFRPALVDMFANKMPSCAALLASNSKNEALEAVRSRYHDSIRKATKESDRDRLVQERALEQERTEAQFDGYLKKFNDCKQAALESTRYSKEEVDAFVRVTLRNAYVIYQAHVAFGPFSSSYHDYTASSNFAAPEMAPFAAGDLGVTCILAVALFLTALAYKAFEYAEAELIASACWWLAIGAMSALLFLPIIGFSTPSQPYVGVRLFYEKWAVALHWASLCMMPLLIWAIFSVTRAPSTRPGRIALTAAYMGLPIALFIIASNEVNGVEGVAGSEPTCKRAIGYFAGAINCAAHEALTPIVKNAGGIATWALGWPREFQKLAASRIAVGAATSLVAAWPVSIVLLMLLKREFVRPRDR